MPGAAQRVDRGIALLFHDRGTRRGWVVSRTLRPHFTPRQDPVPILQEARWAAGPDWTGGKSRPHRHWISDRPTRSQSLHRLSYRAQQILNYDLIIPRIVRVIKSRRMRWAGHVAPIGEGRGVYRVLVGKPEGKRPLGRPRSRWEDNITMNLQEVGCVGIDWIERAQDRYWWRAMR
jgi:hypothetical protein